MVEIAHPLGVGGLLEGTRWLVLLHGFISELCTSIPSAVCSVCTCLYIKGRRDVFGCFGG